MSRLRRTMSTRRVCTVGLLTFCLADVHAQRPSLDELVLAYRSGAIDKAVQGLNEHLAASDAPRTTRQWIEAAVRRGRQADLEAALLLYSESAMVAWSQRQGGPIALKTHLDSMARIHRALEEINPKSPFLRSWYLAWESFAQAQAFPVMSDDTDYLDAALDAFPEDAQVLLAAGSRQELDWWTSFENAQRDPQGDPGTATRSLTAARGFLRRSVAADVMESEARLRLVRVLIELGDLDGAATVLRQYDWAAHGRAFEYLMRLFEGELHERRRDPAAAARSYDMAISLVAVSQSARIARSHLFHAEGLRSEAAETAMKAVTAPLPESDPWWWYVRGQAWRFDSYLKNARAKVRLP